MAKTLGVLSIVLLAWFVLMPVGRRSGTSGVAIDSSLLLGNVVHVLTPFRLVHIDIIQSFWKYSAFHGM